MMLLLNSLDLLKCPNDKLIGYSTGLPDYEYWEPQAFLNSKLQIADTETEVQPNNCLRH